jgi:N-acetylneuraminic acid mutarotase
MNKKTLVFVALSLSVCATVYGSDPVAPAASWTAAMPMNRARAFFAAAELPNGNILVAGGFDNGVNFADSEIYDWHTGLWTKDTASMNQARSAPVAVQLENGRVMVIGGFAADGTILNTAEIYDPRTNTWSMIAAPMHDARVEDFVAVLLPGRKVLVAGGFSGVTSISQILSSAEIFDEKTGMWSATSDMNVARGEFANVMLLDGRVLVMGGVTVVEGMPPTFPATASAEIFDPKTQQWTLTDSMSTAREDHAAVLLRDGRVLVAGGEQNGDFSQRFKTAEIFDPKTGNWSTTGSMNVGRSEIEYAAVRLPDGRVLVPGGYVQHLMGQPGMRTSTADLFDPKTGTWAAAGMMSAARAGHAAKVLRGNRGVLVMGGLTSASAATNSVDIFEVAPSP